MNIIVLALVIVVVALAVAFALRRSARSRLAQDAAADDRHALITAGQVRGRLSVAELARRRGWTVERSKSTLDRLTRANLAEHRLSDTGADEYHFSSLDTYQASDTL